MDTISQMCWNELARDLMELAKKADLTTYNSICIEYAKECGMIFSTKEEDKNEYGG